MVRSVRIPARQWRQKRQGPQDPDRRSPTPRCDLCGKSHARAPQLGRIFSAYETGKMAPCLDGCGATVQVMGLGHPQCIGKFLLRRQEGDS